MKDPWFIVPYNLLWVLTNQIKEGKKKKLTPSKFQNVYLTSSYDHRRPLEQKSELKEHLLFLLLLAVLDTEKLRDMSEMCSCQKKCVEKMKLPCNQSSPALVRTKASLPASIKIMPLFQTIFKLFP